VAEAKTTPTGESVGAFIGRLADQQRRNDCAALVRLMSKAAGEKGAMYGPSIIGFGLRSYKYASGRTGQWPLVAFSPRKANLTLYVGASRAPKALLEHLGKHKVSGSCLHIKRLSDVHLDVLGRVIADSVKRAKARDLAE
jgi:uncharacterized protein DUF1801